MPYLFLPHTQLQALLDAISQAGFAIIGPQVREGAIVYDWLNTAEQLPWGMQDVQSPGEYRLRATKEKLAFAWANGPQAIKPQLFKPTESLWEVTRDEQGRLAFQEKKPETQATALFAVKACDIRAMLIQDKVFIDSDHPDAHYTARRKNVLIVAANCTYSPANCFCVSAGGYPRAEAHFDIAMTEITHGLVMQAGSATGESIVNTLSLASATDAQIKQAQQGIEHAANSQSKKLPLPNDGPLRDMLFNHLDHPRWDDVAQRCLSCGNCTSVCPTCFCSNVESKTALEGQHSEQVREWGSCFTQQHSYIVGKVIRPDTKTRYRQWLTHKVGSWHEQFDSSGCVGCGRCITWCPVGIDITEELTAIHQEEKA
jgi:sulfhydrogenase subunit beta (sulfur reductase)